MGKVYPVKVLGKARAMVLRNRPEKLGVRYDTVIYNNQNDEEYVRKLSLIGIDVVTVARKHLRILLPVGWAHLRISKEVEIIIDDQSRVRMGVDLKQKFSIIYRRYDFTIQVASMGDGDDKLYSVTTQITDNTQVIHEYFYSPEQLQDVEITKYAKTDDEVTEAFKITMANIMDATYPDWRDETAYWEE